MTAACGGSKPEAKAPITEAADSSGVGSPAPAPVADGPTPDLPKGIAVASAENGSDIVPPFSTGKDAAAAPKKSTPAKGGQKKATTAKPKKKG